MQVRERAREEKRRVQGEREAVGGKEKGVEKRCGREA